MTDGLQRVTLSRSEKAESPSRSALVAAINVHSKAYSSLAVTFSTAYFEYPFSHAQYGGDAIASLTRFAQLLVGLRGSLPADDSIGKNDELTLKVKDALKALVVRNLFDHPWSQRVVSNTQTSWLDRQRQMKHSRVYSNSLSAKLHLRPIIFLNFAMISPTPSPPSAKSTSKQYLAYRVSCLSLHHLLRTSAILSPTKYRTVRSTKFCSRDTIITASIFQLLSLSFPRLSICSY